MQGAREAGLLIYKVVDDEGETEEDADRVHEAQGRHARRPCAHVLPHPTERGAPHAQQRHREQRLRDSFKDDKLRPMLTRALFC